MRYAKIKPIEIENGCGCGASLFVQGCRLHCKGCFNQETWDFEGGEEWTEEVKNKFLEDISPWYIQRVSILGGEPLEPENVEEVTKLVKEIFELYPKKEIWLYTGKSVNDVPFNLKSMCSYVVDGPYVESKRNISLHFRGSENQTVWEIITCGPNYIEHERMIFDNERQQSNA